MALPIMAKATAVWLVDNTTMSFKQIADFCGLHELEVNGIADGEVAIGIKGFDPISNNQLDAEEIEKAEADVAHKLHLKYYAAAEGELTRKGPRYTPLSRRQDRPSAIAWLVKFHPELADSQISKLVGTTKPTITAIRDRSHWNINNILPVDPVALGMCKQMELDAAVGKAAAKKAKADEAAMTDEDRMKLVSIEQSLQMETEPTIPASMAGLEHFTLSSEPEEEEKKFDADSLFKKPEASEDDDS